jgi:hypothetical protein
MLLIELLHAVGEARIDVLEALSTSLLEGSEPLESGPIGPVAVLALLAQALLDGLLLLFEAFLRLLETLLARLAVAQAFIPVEDDGIIIRTIVIISRIAVIALIIVIVLAGRDVVIASLRERDRHDAHDKHQDRHHAEDLVFHRENLLIDLPPFPRQLLPTLLRGKFVYKHT